MGMTLSTLIGQKDIRRELSAISNQIRTSEDNATLLLKGPAGSGKTHIARIFMYETFGKEYGFQYPTKANGFSFIWNDLAKSMRGHFIDEIHLVDNIEETYPIIDSRQYTMSFCSNLSGGLLDAFSSRCFVYTLVPYTLEELSLIAKDSGLISLSDTDYMFIAKCCRGSPRILLGYMRRLRFLMSSGEYVSISKALKDIGIYAGGYTTQDFRYLKLLSSQNVLSLNALSRILQIDDNTIVNDIEPFLIMKNHIQITGRGRKFISWESLND